ncbi:amino acid transporter heavy chain SLC3A2-like [Engraulis encrasicolus]|uniref:amino acid transporter heavy chain SLC3A2-like n=1 Tax=Engraulis encrasicolus TaxID=184585 RepID=UPI002FCF91F8
MSSVEMKDVELNDLEEKQPMTGDAKNGTVKVNVSEDDVKFTGLSKEELMRVAGTAGWVRTRWFLLILFWLGWLGMLAGAIVIIIQAPRCKELPEMNWWNEGPLYQIRNMEAFAGAKGLAGVEERLDSLGQLKLKGLILGPLHNVQRDHLATLDWNTIDPAIGTMEKLQSLLDKAHKKGISIVLDLTPNYDESSSTWFRGGLGALGQKLKEAVEHWTSKGVDGLLFDSMQDLLPIEPEHWAPLQEAVEVKEPVEGIRKKAFMGASDDVQNANLLLNTTGVNMLMPQLAPDMSGQLWASTIQELYSSNLQTRLGWSLSRPSQGHLATVVTPRFLKLYELMLFTLPGTPVFNYGDEIGLEDKDTVNPEMTWDFDEVVENNAAIQEQRAELKARRDWFRVLSDLRGKERSLAHGDYAALHSSDSSLAYVRLWDQSQRFITAVNWGNSSVTLKMQHEDLPAEATILLTTEADRAQDSVVQLEGLEIGPGQAVLLSYPFHG